MTRVTNALALSAIALAAAPLVGFADDIRSASAEMRNAAGEEIGRATFTQLPAGLLIEVEAEGLSPGAHGIHIHETGACAPDFEAAGDHFAPDGGEHGFAATETPHAADIPNIEAGDDGRARAAFLNVRARLSGGDGAMLDDDGAALIIHAEADDYRDVDSAGGRVACGVIEAAG